MGIKVKIGGNWAPVMEAYLGDSAECREPRYFIMYRDDCFSPPLYLIRADGWEEAHDIFTEHHPETEAAEESIDETAMKLAGFSWTSVGRPGLDYSEACAEWAELEEQDSARVHDLRMEACEELMNAGIVGYNDSGTLYGDGESINGFEVEDIRRDVRGIVWISRTFQTVTPESAEHGDCEDSGFDEEPYPWIPGAENRGILADAIRSARGDGISEPSSSSFESGDPSRRISAWWTTPDGDPDYHTGATTYYSFHVDGITPATARRITRYLGRR